MNTNRQKNFLEPSNSIKVKGCIYRYSVEYQKCMSLKTVRTSSHVFFDVHKRRSAFDNGKNPGNQLIPDDIDNRHSGFPISQPPVIILFQFGISTECASCSHVQHLFYMLVGDGTDLRPSMHTGSRLIVKRSNAGITGKLSPIIKTSEIVGIYNQMRGNNKSDTSNGFQFFYLRS